MKKVTSTIDSDAPRVSCDVGANTLLSLAIVALEYLIVAACIIMAETYASDPMYVLGVALIGTRLRALNNLVHEASHNSLSPNRKINRLLGHICGFPTLLSVGEYKRSHMLHHARLGCDDDPDLMRLRRLGLDPMPHHIRWLRVLVAFPRSYTVYVMDSLYLVDKLSLAKRLTFVSLIVAGLFIAAGERALEVTFFYWAVPFFTSYQIVKFFAETGEHFGLYQRVPPESPITEKAMYMTRNTKVSGVVAFLLYPYGDNFHMLHHRYPSVPGTKLSILDVELNAKDWYLTIGYTENCPLWGDNSLLRLLMR